MDQQPNQLEQPEQIQYQAPMSDPKYFLNKKFAITFVILLLLGGGAYAGIWYYQNQQLAQEVAPTFTPRPSASVDWHTYTNSDYGFQLTFPDIWTGYRVVKTTESYGSHQYTLLLIQLPILDANPTGYATPFTISIYPLSMLKYLSPGDYERAQNAKLGQNDMYLFTNADGTWNDIPPYFRNKDLQINQTKASFKFIDSTDTLTWKTYTNTQYGFEFRYPYNLVLEEKVLGTDSQYALNILLNNNGPKSPSEFGASIFVKVATHASKSKFKDTCTDPSSCTLGERVYINSCEYHLSELEGNHTTKEDGYNINYSIFRIGGIKACSQYYWRFAGESQSGKVAVAIAPNGTRYEFIVPIGYGLDIQKALALTDDSLKEWENKTNNAYFGEPRKGSSNNVNFLNQILSTFKFTK